MLKTQFKRSSQTCFCYLVLSHNMILLYINGLVAKHNTIKLPRRELRALSGKTKRNLIMKKNKRNIIYFTLMEMVVVIAIIALLATIVTPMYFKHVKKARINTAKTQIALLEQSIMDYQLDTGKIPNSLQDLTTNVSSVAKWDGPYLKSKVPQDPWGAEYIFVSPGTHGEFDIICYGPDTQPGGTGKNADIGNWVE